MTRTLLVVMFAVALTTVGYGQGTPIGQGIPVGGPLPDNSGFTEKLKDPKIVAEVKKQYVVRKVAGNVYIVAGGGGNVEIQVGPDGILMVDDGYSVFYENIMEQIRKVSDKPIRMLFNTHSHPDHHQNNIELAKQGTLIITTPATRASQMQQQNATGTGPYPREGLAVVTAAWPMSLYFNGEEISYIPLKTTETPGEIAMYFRSSDVWVFGDVFINQYTTVGVPFGGTVENIIDNYDLALQMTTPDTVFVAGHGQLQKRETIMAMRDAFTTVHARMLDMVKRGMTLEQVLEAKPSKEFDARFAPENVRPNSPFTNTRWITQMYNEAKGHMGKP